MTGVYPYARLDLNERVSAWGLIGFGSGELTLRQKDEDPMQTDLGMRMGALGVKGQVLDGSGPSGIGVNIKSDAMWVRTTSERTEGMMGAEGEVSRLRLILEGERQFAMEGGGDVRSLRRGRTPVRRRGRRNRDRARGGCRNALHPRCDHHRGPSTHPCRSRGERLRGVGEQADLSA